MGTSRATFKINLTKNNGVLTDRSRVGGKAHKERGEGFENFYIEHVLVWESDSLSWGELLARACGESPVPACSGLFVHLIVVTNQTMLCPLTNFLEYIDTFLCQHSVSHFLLIG